MNISVMDLKPQHIEEFYQEILADNCTTNTAIHSYTISEREVSSADTLEVAMAPGGGQAVSFMPAI